MRTMMWAGLVAGLGLWSLLAVVLHGAVGWFGGFMIAHADFFTGHPKTVAGLGWLLDLARDLAGWAVMVIWALGSLAILGLGWLLKRRGAVPRLLPRLQ